MALLTAASARSEGQRRIVVLQPDDELFRAISLSLSPWDVETTRSAAAIHGANAADVSPHVVRHTR